MWENGNAHRINRSDVGWVLPTPPSTLRLMAAVCPQGFDLIFLGTGTSGSVPNVSCLTAPPGHEPCWTCLSTLTPEGKKNIRRNTSAIIRVDGADGKKVYAGIFGSHTDLTRGLITSVLGQFSSMRERISRLLHSNGFRSMDCAVSTLCCLPMVMQMVSAYTRVVRHVASVLTPFSHEWFR